MNCAKLPFEYIMHDYWNTFYFNHRKLYLFFFLSIFLCIFIFFRILNFSLIYIFSEKFHKMSFVLCSIFNYWSKRIYRKIYFNSLSNITNHVSNNFIWIWQNKIFTKLAWNINLKIKQTLDQFVLLILHKQLFMIIIQIINQSIIHIIPNIILTKIKKIPPPILRLSSND